MDGEGKRSGSESGAAEMREGHKGDLRIVSNTQTEVAPQHKRSFPKLLWTHQHKSLIRATYVGTLHRCTHLKKRLQIPPCTSGTLS